MTDKKIPIAERYLYREKLECADHPDWIRNEAYRFAEKLHAKDKTIAAQKKQIFSLQKELQRRTELHEHYKQRCEVMSETLDRVDRSIEQVKKVLSGE